MPKDEITVSIDSTNFTIKMTYGLLNECSRVIGDIDAIPDLAFSADVRDQLLVELLSPRNAKGRIEEPISIFTLDISPQDVLTLIEFAGSHVADFFISNMTNLAGLMKDPEREAKLKALIPTSDGGNS